MEKNMEEHRDELIRLNEEWLSQHDVKEYPFNTGIRREAIRRLRSGDEPSRVENWFENLQKAWRIV